MNPQSVQKRLTYRQTNHSPSSEISEHMELAEILRVPNFHGISEVSKLHNCQEILNFWTFLSRRKFLRSEDFLGLGISPDTRDFQNAHVQIFREILNSRAKTGSFLIRLTRWTRLDPNDQTSYVIQLSYMEIPKGIFVYLFLVSPTH